MSLLLSENDPAHDGFAADHQFDVGDVDADASSYHNDEYDGSVHDQASYHGAAVQSFEQDTGDEYQHHQGADAEEQLNDENVCVEEQLDIVNAGVEDQDDFGEELDEAQTGGDGCDGSTMSQLNDGFLYENGTDGDEEQELPADVMENHEDYAALNGNYDDMGEELAAEMVENDGTLAAINESYSGMVDNYAVSGGVMSEGEAGKPGMGEELEEDEEGEDMGEELAAEMVENDGTLAAINESYSGMVDNYAVSGGVISDGEAGKPGLGEELEEDEEGEDMGVDFELMQEDSNLRKGLVSGKLPRRQYAFGRRGWAVEGVSEIPIVGVEANVHISDPNRHI
ncbi:hypothetical protein BC829DRAFT_45212 [Chytridium lagenaria]|nr:hypothetical protein BC829DRAFT_45212 [Chytridium lagenaria]